jgi:hypothetical protein
MRFVNMLSSPKKIPLNPKAVQNNLQSSTLNFVLLLPSLKKHVLSTVEGRGKGRFFPKQWPRSEPKTNPPQSPFGKGGSKSARANPISPICFGQGCLNPFSKGERWSRVCGCVIARSVPLFFKEGTGGICDSRQSSKARVLDAREAA